MTPPLPRLSLSLLLLTGCGDKTTDDTAPTTSADDTAAAPADADGDGFSAPEDCDDESATVYPGADELCDGVDSDCDGAALDGEADDDGDGELDCARCADAGLWPQAAHLSVEALFAAELSGSACGSYDTARGILFGTLDNVDGQVEGLYTGRLYDYDPEAPSWDIVNTEHVWPRSQGAERAPVECDLHHLFPADAAVNARRGALPFGEVSEETWSDAGGSRMGLDAAGAEVFEPRDARKGDIARAILYIAARYPEQVTVDAQRSATTLETLRAWHAADPPDDDEQHRSARVQQAQGSVNPFVACPMLIDRL